MSLYAQFKTNTNSEKNGVIVDYGTFRVTIRRAGGSNLAYEKAMKREMKPFLRLLTSKNELDPATTKAVKSAMINVYVEAIIVKWETYDSDTGAFVEGIEDENGNIVPSDKANISKVLLDLEDLFLDLQQQAQSSQLFLQETIEVASKN